MQTDSTPLTFKQKSKNRSITMRMVSIILLFISSCAVYTVHAQITPCVNDTNVGNFGLDGGFYANTPISADGDDWFDSLAIYPGPNRGVIGRTAATAEGYLIISADSFQTRV